MKQVFRSNRLIAVALFSFFSVAFGTAAFANDGDPALPVELKLIGYVEKQPLFQLYFYGDNSDNQFRVNIFDEYGNPLFSENIKGAAVSKKFLLGNDEAGNAIQVVRFEVKDLKTKKTATFEVNRNERLVDDIVISSPK